METKNVPFELKGIEENGIFSGYGSVFGVQDAWDDIVMKGAFLKSLQRKTPALLWQHNPDAPIGIYTDVAEDDRGLKVTGQLLIDDVDRAKEAYALLKAGALSGLSIGYVPQDFEYRDKDVRLLKEVDLWEISLVTFPANDEARVKDVKGVEELATVRDVEGWLRDAKGLTRSEAKTVISKLSRRDAEEAVTENQVIEAAKNLLKAMEV